MVEFTYTGPAHVNVGTLGGATIRRFKISSHGYLFVSIKDVDFFNSPNQANSRSALLGVDGGTIEITTFGTIEISTLGEIRGNHRFNNAKCVGAEGEETKDGQKVKMIAYTYSSRVHTKSVDDKAYEPKSQFLKGLRK